MNDSRTPVILVVDDDLDTRDMYRFVFESSGYSVTDADDVSAALRAAEATPPGLVVTDWILHGGRGIDVLERLRARAALRRLPGIIVTGLALDASTLARAGAAGCERVLLKPVDLDVLTSAAGDAIRVQQARKLRRAARRIWWQAARLRRQSERARSARELHAAAAELLSRERSGSDPRVAFVLADDQARYIAANREATALTGYAPDDLLQLTVWDLTPLSATADGQQLWNAFIARGSQEGRYALVRRDGQTIEADYYAMANVLPGVHLSAITPTLSHRPI